jgi:hypothetical protein
MQLVICLLLAQNRTKAMDRGVSLQDILLGEVWVRQNWGGSQWSLESLKRKFTLCSPKPRDIFLGEVVKWGSNPGEIADEPSVIGGKPEETPDFMNVPWMGKFLNRLEKSRISLEAVSCNHIALQNDIWLVLGLGQPPPVFQSQL